MKKLIIAAGAIFLCSCGIQKENLETDIIETEQPETVYTYTESLPQSETETSGDVTVSGIEYIADTEHLTIDLSVPFAAESVNLEDFREISSITINNVRENDIGFIKQFKNLRHISLYGCNVTDNCITAIKSSDLELYSLYINDDSYSEAEGDALFTAFPLTNTLYIQNSDEWNNGTHNEPFAYYVSPLVPPDNSTPVHLNFTNQTDKTGYASIKAVMYLESGEWEPFDTSEIAETVLEIPSGTFCEFDIQKDQLGIENLDEGRYKLVCTLSRDGDINKFEQESEFYISEPFCNSIPEEIYCPSRPDTGFYCYKTPDFLDDDQLEAFKRAYITESAYFGTEHELSEEYAQTHTAEDFISELTEIFTYDYAYRKALGLYIGKDGALTPVSASSGVDITLIAMNFSLIYESENEVLFKAEMLHGHEDDPYFVWYSERNFHMIKTEDGWKFDVFRLWY